MTDVLTKICSQKRKEIAERKEDVPLAELEERAKAIEPPRGFHAALTEKAQAGKTGLICEIKRASPSKGLIRADFDPIKLAKAYEKGGASCISVLTDEPYFMGHSTYLTMAREAVALPALRKDFILDPYQITESRALGADCILLILAALEDEEARDPAERARAYAMDVLVEVHDREELDRALDIPGNMIGINNRNLKTLEVTLQTTLDLLPHIPGDRLVVAESGLFTSDDLCRCRSHGVNTFLIGEALMRKADVEQATQDLLAGAA